MEKVYIGLIEISPDVEFKLRHRRGFTGVDVREAFQWPARPKGAVWHDHPEYGRRLVVWAESPHGTLKAIMQPVDPDDGTWRLRTCVVAGTTDRSQVEEA